MHALKSEFTNLSFLQHPLESASHAHGTIQGCSTDPASMIQGYITSTINTLGEATPGCRLICM